VFASVRAAVFAVAAIAPATPAAAQWTVFDPSNYAQNVLTAARTLRQINNQIRSLQNQAQSLVNQAKNLSTIGFPEVQALTTSLRRIDQLMHEAQGVQFRIGTVDQQFRKLFPARFDWALTSDAHIMDARERLDPTTAALRQTMKVQAQVVDNIGADADMLRAIVSRSQAAEGGLQAQQATNQLLALAAKQQFQLQNLMAAQYRAEAIERARRLQQRTDARAATSRFLDSGNAYTPR
jgi:P-type conjugative transfer protein TrbJ